MTLSETGKCSGYDSSNGEAPVHVQQLWVRVDLGVMAMKGYSSFQRSSELELHHWMQFSGWVDLGVMAMKRFSAFPIYSELELHHQMWFRVILNIFFLGAGALSICRGYNWCILSTKDRVKRKDELKNFPTVWIYDNQTFRLSKGHGFSVGCSTRSKPSEWNTLYIYIYIYIYLPTPPLGQDMTLDQLVIGV